MKILKDGCYIVVNPYKFTAFEIIFLYYHMLHVRTIPTYRVYQLYDKWSNKSSLSIAMLFLLLDTLFYGPLMYSHKRIFSVALEITIDTTYLHGPSGSQ